MKNVRLALFILIVFFNYKALSQSLKGKVTDAETGEPIPFSNIFFSGTLIGTTSDVSGNFILDGIPAGRYDLIVSFVGYQEYVNTIDLTDSETEKTLNITLSQNIIELEEVSVNADTSEWKNNYKVFKPLFLGETQNALKAEILNPREIFLFFDIQDRSLFAHSKKEIAIENNALGYRINYIMKAFEMDYKSSRFVSLGIVRFESLKAKSRRQEKQWNKQREKAYNGSFQHFLISLKSNRLRQEGYAVYELFKVVNRKRASQELIDSKLDKFKTMAVNISSKSLGIDSMSFWRNIQRMPLIVDSVGRQYEENSMIVDNQSGDFIYKGHLKIIYTLEPEDPSYARWRPGGGVDVKQTTKVQIFDRFHIYDNGYYDVEKVYFDGYMGWASKMADMMPLGYSPTVE